MPKNKTGGKKFRGKKKTNKDSSSTGTRHLELKAQGQEYARVTKLYGNRRIQAIDNQGNECLGIIPGKFKSRVWINVGDIILLGIREFQHDKCDVIYKYTNQESKKLHKMGEITNVLFENKSAEDLLQDDDADSGDNIVYFDDSEDEINKEDSGDLDIDDL
jgi:translation initiation factor 1A